MGRALVNKNKVEDKIKGTDLTVEKRMELYQAELSAFDKNMIEKYGMSIGCELKFAPQGIVPRIVLVDMLAKKKDEPKAEETKA